MKLGEFDAIELQTPNETVNGAIKNISSSSHVRKKAAEQVVMKSSDEERAQESPSDCLDTLCLNFTDSGNAMKINTHEC